MRSALVWVVGSLLALLSLARPLSAQQAAPAAPREASPTIDQILEGEEQILTDSGYNYDPGNRRDPFKSLLAATNRPPTGPRPEGIPGLMIDEIDLTGIFVTKRGFVAQVQASNKDKSYLIKQGDQLFDGDVVNITRNEVVFKQNVNDPTVIKPFREVVKKLYP